MRASLAHFHAFISSTKRHEPSGRHSMRQSARVSSGERVSIEQPLTLLIGSGQYGADEELNVIGGDDQMMQGSTGEVDDFEEVKE